MCAAEADKIKFAHLLPGETRVWRAFLRLYGHLWDRYEYDVHVGRGSLPEEDARSVFTTDYNWLTRKRIDVVGWKGRDATIFEVRARASLPLVGQLEGYRHLWMRQNPDADPPAKMLVCTFAQPDDISAATDQGVDVVVVELPTDDKPK